MSEKLADVLDSARVLADGREYRNGDIWVKSYPENKVRVFVVQGKLNIMIAGDARATDKADAKRVVDEGTISQAKVDAVLKAVVGLAGVEVKPPAPAAAPSA